MWLLSVPRVALEGDLWPLVYGDPRGNFSASLLVRIISVSGEQQPAFRLLLCSSHYSSSCNSLFHASVSNKFVLRFPLKSTFPVFPRSLPPLHHLYFIYIWFTWCFIHIFHDEWSLFSSLFYRPTFSSINTSSAPLLPVVPSFSFLFPSVMFSYRTWHFQSLWPTQNFLHLLSFRVFSFISFVFLSSSCAPRSPRADQPEQFVVGGAELFLSLLSRLVGHLPTLV